MESKEKQKAITEKCNDIYEDIVSSLPFVKSVSLIINDDENSFFVQTPSTINKEEAFTNIVNDLATVMSTLKSFYKDTDVFKEDMTDFINEIIKEDYQVTANEPLIDIDELVKDFDDEFK